MRTVAGRVRALVVVAIASAAFAVEAQVGQPRPDPPPKPTGLMLGQVLDAGTGKPVAGATVSISGGTPSASAVPIELLGRGGAPPADANASSAPRQILTDSSGRFLFRELSKGSYSIRVTNPGYVAGGYGQSNPLGASQSVQFSRDDEKVGDLTVRLWKGASLSGTIVDETGEPVVGSAVRVFRRTMAGGVPRLQAGGAIATTDDRGFYRAADLVPGDYVAAVLSTQTTMPVATAEAYTQQMMAGGSSINSDIYRELTSSGAPSGMATGYRVGDFIFQSGASGRGGGSAPPPAPSDDGTVFTYATQFFPSASVASQATVLSLASGQDRAGIDFQLRLVPTVRVSGTITSPDGPARNLGVKLFAAGAEAFTSDSGIETASTATDAEGTFTFLGVTPGEYTLKCLRIPRPATTSPSSMTMIEVMGPNGMIMGMSSSSGPGPTAALPTDPTLWATLTVSVSDANVTGLSVPLRPGVRLSGQLAFEGTKSQPTPDQLQRAQISVTPAVGATPIQILTATKRVEADGRFSTVGYPPGRYILNASIPPAGPGAASTGWSLKSVTVGGRDVSDDGLETSGEDLSGIVLTFTDQMTEVTGTVADAGGGPDKGASVAVFPADPQAWQRGVTSARRIRNVRTTTKGSYAIPGLPPGDYLIVAVSDESLGDVQDPKTLEKLAAVGTRITIGEGEKKSLALTTKTVR